MNPSTKNPLIIIKEIMKSKKYMKGGKTSYMKDENKMAYGGMIKKPKKMAGGGMACRGMGAAKRGGKYSRNG